MQLVIWSVVPQWTKTKEAPHALVEQFTPAPSVFRFLGLEEQQVVPSTSAALYQTYILLNVAIRQN